MQTKICTKCLEEKVINEFPKAKFGKFGVSSWCINCTKKYFEDNKERFKKQKKAHMDSIPNYHKICYQNIKNNPDRYNDVLLKNRIDKLKRKFGITLEQYNQMLQEQKGVCAICGKEEKSVDYRTKKKKIIGSRPQP